MGLAEPTSSDSFACAAGQDVGVCAASCAGEHGPLETRLNQLDQCRATFDMTGMTAMLDASAKLVQEEHGNGAEPESKLRSGFEQLAQELQSCLSAGTVPTRTPLAQRFKKSIKANQDLKNEYDGIKKVQVRQPAKRLSKFTVSSPDVTEGNPPTSNVEPPHCHEVDPQSAL